MGTDPVSEMFFCALEYSKVGYNFKIGWMILVVLELQNLLAVHFLQFAHHRMSEDWRMQPVSLSCVIFIGLRKLKHNFSMIYIQGFELTGLQNSDYLKRKDHNKMWCLDFVLGNNRFSCRCVRFVDHVHCGQFHLSGYIIKENCLYWTKERPVQLYKHQFEFFNNSEHHTLAYRFFRSAYNRLCLQ
jgi:hypothetical protein